MEEKQITPIKINLSMAMEQEQGEEPQPKFLLKYKSNTIKNYFQAKDIILKDTSMSMSTHSFSAKEKVQEKNKYYGHYYNFYASRIPLEAG
ncbi:unnamed protein product [Gordionus sp. m RMFG-2023]